MKVRAVVALAALAAAMPARAGLFDDEEARRQIADVRRQVEAQAKTLARIESEVTDKKALLELVNQIEALKQENALLRQEVEALRRHPSRSEEIARRDLGLVRPGEIVYQFRKR